jgi:DTW domain-containing protein YfiP
MTPPSPPAAGAAPTPAGGTPPVPEAACPQCHKPTALCVCDGIVPIDNKVSVVILQHPQEQDRTLGTARLTALSLRDSRLKIGLSWPSLSKILGRNVDPHRWAVLYLGSVKAASLAPDREIVFVTCKGDLERDQDRVARDVEGIVVLDGTWSQAKALWWRNPWMLKCRRVVLGPRHPSRYGRLRREPRRDGLSTIEATALLLSRLEHRPEIEETLGASFMRMLGRVRQHGTVAQGAAPPAAPG